MKTECTQVTFEFHGLFQRKVKARFDGEPEDRNADVNLRHCHLLTHGLELQGFMSPGSRPRGHLLNAGFRRLLQTTRHPSAFDLLTSPMPSRNADLTIKRNPQLRDPEDQHQWFAI